MQNISIEREEIKIPLSKNKLILTFVGAWAFVIAGLWLALFLPGADLSAVLAGWAGIIFFGLCGTFLSFKIFDTKPGLIINQTGILDNSSALASEWIRWEEIEGIREIQVKNQKFIQIILKDPEAHIAKHKGYVKYLMQVNYKWYGSPVNISSISLKTNFKELRNIVEQKFLKPPGFQ
jgi:hypothetical protein